MSNNAESIPEGGCYAFRSFSRSVDSSCRTDDRGNGCGAKPSLPCLYPLVPSATVPGGPAFTMTVNGTGFVSGAVVNWNGTARTTTFVSSSQVTAAITAADIATARTAVITVTNPTPGGGKSNPEYFQVTNPTVGLAFQDSPASAGFPGRKPAVGDFNGDGKLDLAIQGGPASNTVQILLGNGNGTFQAPISVVASPGNTTVNDVEVGDFNGDGKLDIVVSTDGIGTSVILGNGNGTFQAPITSVFSNPPANTSTYMTVVADVNGDGIPDLVRAGVAGVFVELGNGDGTFRLQFTYSTPISCRAFNCAPLPVRSVALGDFHKNGWIL